MASFGTLPLGVQTVLSDDLPGATFDALVANFTVGTNSWTATPDGTGTLNGQTDAKYTVGNTTAGELTLWLPAHGAALPIEESGNGAAGGALSFTWNTSLHVTPPAHGEIYSGS